MGMLNDMEETSDEWAASSALFSADVSWGGRAIASLSENLELSQKKTRQRLLYSFVAFKTSRSTSQLVT
jgi:hypothetical protein